MSCYIHTVTLSPGSPRRGKQAEQQFRTYQFAASSSRPLWPWDILAVPQLIEGVSHHRQISSTCSGGWFLTVLGAFQRDGIKPEVVVGGGSRCDGGVFSRGGDCLRSVRSVPTLGHIKDRTSGPLPPPWKTSGLTWPDLGQVGFVEKPRPEHLELTTRNGPRFHG